MVKPLFLSFKIIIFVFLFLGLGINFGAPIFAQEVSFFIEDEGYFGWPVYGKVSIKLLNPGDSCHAEIEFGDNSTPFTMDCNFPTGGDSGSYFLCEHKFMHIYPGPEGRYPLHFGPGSNCMRLEGFAIRLSMFFFIQRNLLLLQLNQYPLLLSKLPPLRNLSQELLISFIGYYPPFFLSLSLSGVFKFSPLKEILN